MKEESQTNAKLFEKAYNSSQNTDLSEALEDVEQKEKVISPSHLPPSRRESISTTQSNASVSKIPRYIRNTTVTNTSASNSNVPSSVSSPVQRKLLTKQQCQKYNKRGQESSERNFAYNTSVQGNKLL